MNCLGAITVVHAHLHHVSVCAGPPCNGCGPRIVVISVGVTIVGGVCVCPLRCCMVVPFLLGRVPVITTCSSGYGNVVKGRVGVGRVRFGMAR